MDSCLGTPVIIRHLLEQFSNKELINLSLVNKQWNFEARCVLRDRSTLTARIWSGDPRQDLVAFASDLEKMCVVPFAGICIVLNHNPTTCRPASNASYDKILDRLPIKTLSLEFGINWDECRDCPAFLLLMKILENCFGVLETLSFFFHWDEMETIEDWFRNLSFPRLKTLRFDAVSTDEDFTRSVKALVSSAPNLKELQMVQEIYFNENVLEGSSAVLVPLYRFNPLYEVVCKSLIPAIRTETIEIYQHYRSREDFNAEILNLFIPKVLRVSLPTLKTLQMDLLFAVPLMCYGMCLENVTRLEIQLEGHMLERLEPRILTLLKRFDFTRIFPKVIQVEIVNECPVLSVDTIDAFVEQGNALLMGAEQDRTMNIKHLILHGSILDSTIPLLAQMFPNVNALTVKTRDINLPTPFTAIWDHFSFLQELNFASLRRPCWIRNEDSVFCGIFPEEVAELRQMDDEYLRAVNIVSVMPSITCMKDLKTCTFRYTTEPGLPSAGDNYALWFSKVTGFIGFARCPALAVTFKTPTMTSVEALRHMEPFANFSSVSD